MCYPEFEAALQANETARVNRMEDALYQRGIGFWITGDKVVVVDKEVRHEPIQVFIPGDVSAQEKWLRAKKSDPWNPARKVEMTGASGAPLVQITLDMDPKTAAELYARQVLEPVATQLHAGVLGSPAEVDADTE
jgi:hypothetical protein